MKHHGGDKRAYFQDLEFAKYFRSKIPSRYGQVYLAPTAGGWIVYWWTP